MAVLDTSLCPAFHRATEIIGGRWSSDVLRVLLDGASRFSEMRNAIPGISDKMLAERLRAFESEGIVSRTVEPETPVRVEYRLTEMGEALRPILDGIGAWADEWVIDKPAARREPASSRTR